MKVLEKKTVADYEALPEGSPYQLIEGELVMSPAPIPYHQIVSGNIYTLIRNNLKGRGIVIYSPVDVCFDEENAYQPDIVVILKGSEAKMTSRGVYGPPDVVVEILSPTTAYYDMKAKKKVYERNDVKEYWLVDPMERSFEIYVSSEEGFKLSSSVVQEGSVSSQLLRIELNPEEVFKEV